MATKTTTTVLDHLRDYLERFIVFPDEAYSLILGLWILHTYTFMESFPRAPWVTPYIYIYSETPGAGKTRLIDVVRPLVYNPEMAGDLSAAAMYTLIEQSRPTLFVDEMDTVFNGSGAGNESLRRTMNTGYTHSGYAIRKMGKEVVKFQTFCAKLLAGINGFDSQIPETVRTRSVPLKLVKGQPREVYYSFMAGPEAEALTAEIDEWIRHNGETIIDYMPTPIQSMEPRAFEISFPLLQLARALGVEEQARAALIRLLAPPERREDPTVALLRHIREIYDARNADKLHTETILAELGESWNGKLLSRKLEKVGGIGATAAMSINGKTLKGYYRHQFSEAWNRYL